MPSKRSSRAGQKGGFSCFGGCFRPQQPAKQEPVKNDEEVVQTRAVTPEELRSAVVLYQSAVSKIEKKAGIEGDESKATLDPKEAVAAVSDESSLIQADAKADAEEEGEEVSGIQVEEVQKSFSEEVPTTPCTDPASESGPSLGSVLESEESEPAVVSPEPKSDVEAFDTHEADVEAEGQASPVSDSPLKLISSEVDNADDSGTAAALPEEPHDAPEAKPVVGVSLEVSEENHSHPVSLKLTVNEDGSRVSGNDFTDAPPRLNAFGAFLHSWCPILRAILPIVACANIEVES